MALWETLPALLFGSARRHGVLGSSWLPADLWVSRGPGSPGRSVRLQGRVSLQRCLRYVLGCAAPQGIGPSLILSPPTVVGEELGSSNTSRPNGSAWHLLSPGESVADGCRNW